MVQRCFVWAAREIYGWVAALNFEFERRTRDFGLWKQSHKLDLKVIVKTKMAEQIDTIVLGLKNLFVKMTATEESNFASKEE